MVITGTVGAEKPIITDRNISDQITFGIIPSGSNSPFHQELIRGAEETAAKYGLKTIILTPDNEENTSAQKDAMKTLIEQKVNVISLNSLNPELVKQEIIDAENAGIPVIMHNTLTFERDLNITSYIGYNQFTGAAEMGMYASRLLAEKNNEYPPTIQGNVFILRGLPGFHADQRTAGFIEGLSQSPGIKIVGMEIAGWDRETAKTIASKALKENPQITIFYGNSDEMAIGASLAAMEYGKEINRDIFCYGIDGNTPTLEMIKNGTMTATLGVYPEKIGEEIIRQMIEIYNGNGTPRFVETPSMVVDLDTLDSYVNRTSWSEPVESAGEKKVPDNF
jgi:ribose transport system substrate-binding protein